MFEGAERMSGDWSLVNEEGRGRKRDEDGKMGWARVAQALESHGKELGFME